MKNNPLNLDHAVSLWGCIKYRRNKRRSAVQRSALTRRTAPGSKNVFKP